MQDVSRGTWEEGKNSRLEEMDRALRTREGDLDVPRGTSILCAYELGDNAPASKNRFWEPTIFCRACQVQPG